MIYWPYQVKPEYRKAHNLQLGHYACCRRISSPTTLNISTDHWGNIAKPGKHLWQETNFPYQDPVAIDIWWMLVSVRELEDCRWVGVWWAQRFCVKQRPRGCAQDKSSTYLGVRRLTEVQRRFEFGTRRWWEQYVWDITKEGQKGAVEFWTDFPVRCLDPWNHGINIKNGKNRRENLPYASPRTD